MTHRFAICLAIAASLFAAPRPAAAAITTVFDTVDAVEIATSGLGYNIIVTGIVAGGTTPTTLTFFFSGTSSGQESQARQCERLAVLAMSKPGKYQFGIGPGSVPSSGCKLILRTP
jgi:hypothetical protein